MPEESCHPHICVFICLIIYLIMPAWPVLASLEDDMAQPRQDYARLLDTLYAHRALQDGLRPGIPNSTLGLSLFLVPYNVVSLDERSQTMESYLVVSASWYDPDLSWSPADYGGTEIVSLPTDKIWYPTFLVVNARTKEYQWLEKPTKINLNFQGIAYYTVCGFTKTSCSLDLTNYPMDSQECHVILTPILDAHAIEINDTVLTDIPETDDSTKHNGEWELKEASLSVETALGGLTSVANCRLVLKRRTLFYVLCMLVPMFVTASLTAFVFWIPASSGEKVSFLVSLFLANTVMVNFIGDTMPRGLKSYPRLLVFMTAVMLECVVAVFSTAFVLYKYKQEQEIDEAKRSTESTAPTKRVSRSSTKVWPATPDTENARTGWWTRVKSDTWDKIFFAFFLFTMIPVCFWCWF